MNTWLCERYHLPEHLYTGRDPGIEEVDYSEMNRILTLLKEYRNIPAEAVQDVRVFTPERLISFLEKSVQNAKIPPLLY